MRKELFSKPDDLRAVAIENGPNPAKTIGNAECNSPRVGTFCAEIIMGCVQMKDLERLIDEVNGSMSVVLPHAGL
jgi:hypothetical protein